MANINIITAVFGSSIDKRGEMKKRSVLCLPQIQKG